MNKTNKQAYEAPRAEYICFKQSLDVLIGFSFEGDVETPTLDEDWGDQNSYRGNWGSDNAGKL